MFEKKEIFLAALTVIIGTTVFWFWNDAMPLIVAGEFQNYVRFLFPVAGLVLSGSLFALTAFFVRNDALRYGAVLALAIIPFFFVPASATVLSILGASVFLLSFSAYRIKKEFFLSHGFSVSKISKTGVPLFFTVSSMIVAAFYLTQIDEEKAVSALLPRSATQFLFRQLSPAASSLTGVPNISPATTVDDAINELVKNELARQGTDVSGLARQELSRLIAAQRQEFSKQYGFQLEGKERVLDLVYNAIFERAKELLGPYKTYLPYTSALIFFAAFKTFTVPLYYLTLAATFFLIKILVAVRILIKEKRTIEVERLTL